MRMRARNVCARVCMYECVRARDRLSNAKERRERVFTICLFRLYFFVCARKPNQKVACMKTWFAETSFLLLANDHTRRIPNLRKRFHSENDPFAMKCNTETHRFGTFRGQGPFQAGTYTRIVEQIRVREKRNIHAERRLSRS